MAKIKTKYGTIIDVTGLTSEQVAKVKNTAEGKGAYGAKGAALADAMRKKNSKGAAGKGNTGTGELIDTKTGGFDDPQAVLDAMPKIPGATDLQGEVDKSRQGAFNYLTQYDATDKARELEDAKQELAQRGIPIDPTEGSLWQKTMQGIDRKYQSLKDQAMNQSYALGNQTLETETGAAATASDAFLKAVLGMSDADLQRFGIKKDYKSKMQAIAAQERAARLAHSGRGRGGGGSDSTDIIIGGDAP